jgi:TupA-like ATPgrasp
METLDFRLTHSRSLPPPTLDAIALCYYHYRRVFGRFPNLLVPQRFTEKIVWRRLFDLNPLYAVLSDKIAVRDFVTARVGAQWLPPLLWTGDSPDEIPFDRLKSPFILKCNHGAALNVIALDPATIDREDTRRRLRSWLALNYGRVMREPAYAPIRPRLLAEHLMFETSGLPPIEHKIFVFNGRARIVWSIVVDAKRSRFDAVYTHDWRPLHWRGINPSFYSPLPPPEKLDKFIELAETIGAGFDHIRVDFYEWNKRPVVGELTLYSYAGETRFEPDDADFVLGSWWELPQPVRRALAPTFRGLPLTCLSVPLTCLRLTKKMARLTEGTPNSDHR